MPLTITVPGRDMFDQRTSMFITTKPTTLVLEHSLLSISKWEAKWHKPYLSTAAKTEEEALDYIRCMCITQNVNPEIFMALDNRTLKEITDYINNPMTATTFRKDPNERPNREIITNELVYYWMAELGLPFDPCEKWHLNRLMTLIKVASIKKQPPKKMGRKEMISQRNALNAQRKAKYKTHG